MSSDEMTTKPTIETVLERISSLTEQVSSFAQQVTEIHEIVVELREGQEKFKDEISAGFKKIDRKLSVLNDNLLTMKADQRDLESRVETLESK
jgi:predicted RNase H-like nuclease (RuvC/YqgF family)